jgi:hypothetical protein
MHCVILHDCLAARMPPNICMCAWIPMQLVTETHTRSTHSVSLVGSLSPCIPTCMQCVRQGGGTCGSCSNLPVLQCRSARGLD